MSAAQNPHSVGERHDEEDLDDTNKNIWVSSLFSEDLMQGTIAHLSVHTSWQMSSFEDGHPEGEPLKSTLIQLEVHESEQQTLKTAIVQDLKIYI